MSMTSAIQGAVEALRQKQAAAFARAYVDRHESLKSIIDFAGNASQSSGVGVKDYVAFFETIRRKQPKVVLECGTGRSTMVIAQAMLENAGGKSTGDMKPVSMEHNRQWYDHQVPLIPPQFRSFVEIRYSPMDIWGYSMLRGACYKEIPEYPYEFVFVDGPHQGFENNEPMCNIDFLRIVSKTDKPVSALVDNRKHTIMAFTLALRPGKVRYHSVWGLRVVSPVTRADLALHDKNAIKRKGGIFRLVAKKTLSRPF